MCYVHRTLSPQDASQLREFYERIVFERARLRAMRYNDNKAHLTFCQFRKRKFSTEICRRFVLDIGGYYLSTSKACNLR